MGGDLGGTGGPSTPKFELGDGPCNRPPNILRSSVIGCLEMYELSKKGVQEEFFLKWRFFFKKSDMVYIGFQTVETGK